MDKSISLVSVHKGTNFKYVCNYKFTIELPMPNIIAQAFKDALYFVNLVADLPTIHKQTPEQPGSSQPIPHWPLSGRF